MQFFIYSNTQCQMTETDGLKRKSVKQVLKWYVCLPFLFLCCLCSWPTQKKKTLIHSELNKSTIYALLQFVCLCVCAFKRYLQDILYLADNVFSVRAFSLQGDAVSDSLLVQSGQLHLRHSQTHTALLPTCPNTVRQLKTGKSRWGNMAEHGPKTPTATVAVNSELTCLPEILEVPLDVKEQRVLQRLDKLSVYFLWDQFCSSPVCK